MVYIPEEAILNLVVQYPDLSELYTSANFADPRVDLAFAHRKVSTEFAFATTVNRTGIWTEGMGINGLLRAGFQPISAMKNWFPNHLGDKWPIIFWWKRMHTGPDVALQKATRTYWSTYTAENLHFSGCGFKIAEEPLLTEKYHKYFTLLRMSKEIGGIQTKWLNDHNFRMIAEGTFANFWINGWDPKAWTYENEIEYFNQFQARKNAQIKAEPESQDGVVG